MRILLLLGVLIFIDIYAFQAFRLIAQNWSAHWRNILFISYWGIVVLAIGTAIAAYFTDINQWNRALFTILRSVLVIAYVSKSIITLFLLIDDVRRLFSMGYEWIAGDGAYSPSRSRFLSQMGLMMGGLPFATLTYGILRNPYRYKVYRNTIELENLPETLDGLKVLQISDIHSGSFFLKEPVSLAVDMINREQADLVFFTGDLVNSVSDEMDPFVDVFDKIQSRYGVYSVFGNHDYGDYAEWDSPEAKKKNLDKLIDIHQRLGWDLLRNENRILDIHGEKIGVIGVENYSALPRFPKYGDLQKAYAGVENTALKLLLSHDPSHWEDQVVRDYKDIDITFSGHTHGFQFGIEIPGFLRWSPSQYMYKQWAGHYQEANQHLYVNRGLGFLGYPGRVGILPEITVIELRRKQSN